MFAVDGRLRSGAPTIVGVLNVTPDSFSDGGRFANVDEAIACGVAMVDAGAHWIDVGGESTRPGAAVVDGADELARVVPVIEGLASRLAGRALISIDTYKSTTARAALQAGARVVNDISAGVLDAGLLSVAAAFDAPVVLGHLRGQPATMMDHVHFDDVVAEVVAELQARVEAARAAGCHHIWVDPGIGFGKRLPQNLALLRHLRAMREALQAPMMVGVSRKRFIGELTGQAASDRGYGTAAALALAVDAGVEALRVHDVAPARDVVAVASAIARA